MNTDVLQIYPPQRISGASVCSTCREFKQKVVMTF